MAKQKLTPNERAKLGGRYYYLPAGITHYEVGGPEDGPVVVLIHGFTTPMFGWDQLFADLTEAGYRTVRFDLFGRGLSDRPRVANTIDFFATQLSDLIDALKVQTPLTLIGWSMGCMICARFAERHPAKVKQLALISPGGMALRKPVQARLATAPVVGNMLAFTIGEWFVNNSNGDQFSDPAFLPAYMEKFKVQLQYDGFMWSQQSTLRNFPFDFSKTFRAVGALHKPILLIWGTEDETTPYSGAKLAQQLMPQAELMTVEGAKHAVHIEFSAQVNARILAFLTE